MASPWATSSGYRAWDLPNWIDLLVVAIFSLVMFYYAVSVAGTPEQIQETVRKEERAIEQAPDIRTA